MSTLTGRISFRRDWRNRLVLQVEVASCRYDMPGYQPTNRYIWRDATPDDIGEVSSLIELVTNRVNKRPALPPAPPPRLSQQPPYRNPPPEQSDADMINPKTTEVHTLITTVRLDHSTILQTLIDAVSREAGLRTDETTRSRVYLSTDGTGNYYADVEITRDLNPKVKGADQ